MRKIPGSRKLWLLAVVSGVAMSGIVDSCLLYEAAADDAALPTLRPDEALRTEIAESIRVQYVLRDERDTTLVQTMIQVDKPPAGMAFEVALKAGDATWPLGPVAWSTGKIGWWAFDADLPRHVANVDIVFTPSAQAGATLRRLHAYRLPDLKEIWSGDPIVRHRVKVGSQRVGMVRLRPLESPAAIDAALELLDASDPVVRQLRTDRDLDHARRRLQQRLNTQPEDGKTLYQLACLEFAAGESDAALDRLAAAVEQQPPAPLSRQIQRQLRRLCATWLYQAERDDSASMCLLGRAYERGWGVGQDFQSAKRWLRNAANAGHVEAMRRLAGMYDDRLGATVRTEQADAWYRDQTKLWYQKAAELGDKVAQQWVSEKASQ